MVNQRSVQSNEVYIIRATERKSEFGDSNTQALCMPIFTYMFDIIKNKT